MTHSSDHSEPPVPAHWAGHLADESATVRLGAALARCLVPGLRIYLHGELGAGKTTLVRGLLKRLGVQSGIKSPSYALVEVYVVSRLHLYHFDFYRFLSSDEFGAAGFPDYFRGDGVCLVEWPENAAGALPAPDLELWLRYEDGGRGVKVDAFSERGKRCLTGLQSA